MTAVFVLNMPKAVIFIDGNNFYFKLKKLSLTVGEGFSLLDFDFYGFCKWLVEPNILSEARYYIGAVRRQDNSEKSEKLYANQQRLIGKLQQQKVGVILGNLIQHPDKSFHEKGVDVRIAVEMIRLARQDKFDIAYLLSSDTDLVSALEEVQSIGKKVVYAGTAQGQSFGLTKQANDAVLLRPDDIKSFLKLN